MHSFMQIHFFELRPEGESNTEPNIWCLKAVWFIIGGAALNKYSRIRIRFPSTECSYWTCFACESHVINKRVSTSDGNVECCQRSVTGEAAFPYGTTNTRRQADTLEQPSSSSSHHHERTICSERIRVLILLRFCIFRFCANERRRGYIRDTFGIRQTGFRL